MEFFRVLKIESQCISWTTRLPLVDSSYRSPKFDVNGDTLYGTINGSYDSTKKCEKWHIVWHKEPISNNGQSCGNVCILSYIKLKDGKLFRFSCGQKLMEIIYLNKGLLSQNEIREGVVSLFFMFDCDSKHLKDVLIKVVKPYRNTKKTQTDPDNYLYFCHLSKDIGKMFDKGGHSDAVLRCGDRSFHVNKSILSARSDVFAAMFRSNMKEDKTGVVDIADMDSSIMDQFLKYLYSGKVEDFGTDSAIDLYSAGDKYSVPSLKQKCGSFLVDNLSEDNVCQVLLLAETFGDDVLLDSAVDFALETNDFLGSRVWKDFAEEHPALAVKVFLKYHTEHEYQVVDSHCLFEIVPRI